MNSEYRANLMVAGNQEAFNKAIKSIKDEMTRLSEMLQSAITGIIKGSEATEGYPNYVITYGEMEGNNWVTKEEYDAIHNLQNTFDEMFKNLQKESEMFWMEFQNILPGSKVYKMGTSLLFAPAPVIGVVKEGKNGYYVKIITQGVNKKRSKSVYGWERWDG